jgi:DNA transformation protein
VTADPDGFRDLFSDLGEITTRSMMGGLSVYADGRIFAAADRVGMLYLRAKGALAHDLRSMGGRPFVVARRDGSEGAMGYVSLPEAALDEPEMACDLARRALAEG